ncbi:MAG: restriction endonuclease subunit S [Saprospiraceae bacterium]|nr:restriction endonuclease subunit S [Saprospiraceae bacterium]
MLTFPVNLFQDKSALELGELPPLPIQQKIASILSAYDDLIENNMKRIKLLEEAAQHLYREWFVNFRFPGWEAVRMVDGLPEGWEKSKVSEVFKVIKGRKPSTEFEEWMPGRKPFLLVDVLERKTQRFTEDDSMPECFEGEIVMLMDGSRSGIVFRAIDGLLGSTVGLFRVKNEKVGPSYSFHFFKYRETEIRSKNTGAAIPHANKSYIMDMDFNIPAKEIVEHFENVVGNFHKQIETLHKQNQRLKEGRDLLLPRLMSGALEV